MRHYTKILICENKRRLNKLIDFREFVFAYFDNGRTEWNMDSKNNEITAPEARKRINRSVKEVHSMIVQSEINPILTWMAPPTAGGYSVNINLIANIFNLHEFQIDPPLVLDVINRTIGIYQSNHKKARARACNPLFYVGLVLDFISDLPFIALGNLALTAKKRKVP